MRIVVLANSYKEGGRCVAGIQLDDKNTPILFNIKPKWIRPVCQTHHNEIPTDLVSHLKIFDVIEFITIGEFSVGYQSENIHFIENSLKKVGSFSIDQLYSLCKTNNFSIFGNHGKAVSKENILSLSHSLDLIKVVSFDIIQKMYEDKPNPQIRIVFKHNQTNYDLPITDPVFLNKYKIDNNLLKNISEIYLVLSLGVEYKEWYYKLVATIIFEEKKIKSNSLIVNDSYVEPIINDDLPF